MTNQLTKPECYTILPLIRYRIADIQMELLLHGEERKWRKALKDELAIMKKIEKKLNKIVEEVLK